MKQRKLLTTLAIALAVICGLTIGASASDTLKEIKAYLNYGITIQYNSEVQTLRAADGSTVYPITYNGTTYLPVRSIGNIFGVAVDWDQATQTVILGNRVEANGGASVNMLDTMTPYTKYQSTSIMGADRYYGAIFYQNLPSPIQIGGETVSSYLNLWTGQTEPGIQGPERINVSFNLGGKYSNLTFKAYTDQNTTLTVKGDNDSILGEYALTGGAVPQTITIDLHNTTQLTFQRALAPCYSNSKIPQYAINTYIFDAILK